MRHSTWGCPVLARLILSKGLKPPIPFKILIHVSGVLATTHVRLFHVCSQNAPDGTTSYIIELSNPLSSHFLAFYLFITIQHLATFLPWNPISSYFWDLSQLKCSMCKHTPTTPQHYLLILPGKHYASTPKASIHHSFWQLHKSS